MSSDESTERGDAAGPMSSDGSTERGNAAGTTQAQMTQILGFLQALSAQVSTMGDKVSTMDDKVSTMGTQVSTIGTQVSTLRDDVNKQGDEVVALKSALATSAAKVSVATASASRGFTHRRASADGPS